MNLSECLLLISQHKITTLEECKEILCEGNFELRKKYILELLLAFKNVGLQHQTNQLAELAWHLGIKQISIFEHLFFIYQQQNLYNKALHLLREMSFALYEQRNIFLLPEMLRKYMSIRTKEETLQAEKNHVIGGLQDFLIKSYIRDIVNPYKFENHDINALKVFNNQFNRKIRIGYVLWGDFDDFNNLVPIAINLANLHNKDQFEVYLISYFPKTINNSVRLKNLKEESLKNGVQLLECIMPLDISGVSTWESAYCLARQIYNENIDILIFQGQYTEHSLLTELRPAPILIGFTHGYPEAYTYDKLNCSIDQNILKVCIEEQTDAEFVPYAPFFNHHLDEFSTKIQDIQRSELNISEDSIVLLTVGLATKFDCAETPDFFNMMISILDEYSNTIWIIVGIPKEYITDKIIIEKINLLKNKVIFINKCFDYYKYYNLSDIYIDTYPRPGGLTSYESIKRKIPSVFYKNTLDDGWLFQKNVAYDTFSELMPKHLLANANLSDIKNKIIQLINNKDLRDSLGNELFNELNKYNDVENYIQRIESIYFSQINQYFIKKNEDEDIDNYYILDENILQSELNNIRELAISKGVSHALDEANQLLLLNIQYVDTYITIIDILNAFQQDFSTYLLKMVLFCKFELSLLFNYIELLIQNNHTSNIKYICSVFYGLNKNNNLLIQEFLKFCKESKIF